MMPPHEDRLPAASGRAGGEGDLAPRYAVGDDAGPLIRSLAGGILGAAAALAVDRIWPEPWLALAATAGDGTQALPQGMLWPALAADLSLRAPWRIAPGTLALVLALVLLAFVFTFGQVRRFGPRGDVGRGLMWGMLVWLLFAPALLPRAALWLGSGAAAGRGPGYQMAAASALLAESLVCLLAYGVTVGLLNPAPSSS